MYSNRISKRADPINKLERRKKRVIHLSPRDSIRRDKWRENENPAMRNDTGEGLSKHLSAKMIDLVLATLSTLSVADPTPSPWHSGHFIISYRLSGVVYCRTGCT
ncbi:hypothetical protein CDAR_486131 [Caerostris darwini]|uniref:Uncharacterized protein n=1 Tax=Caerostris darwini TaxID=1538125 RepID=A0AAV4MB86_9ARAC|nr:hypothetical protein CDAR_486131 [Caerostris darwini]